MILTTKCTNNSIDNNIIINNYNYTNHYNFYTYQFIIVYIYIFFFVCVLYTIQTRQIHANIINYFPFHQNEWYIYTSYYYTCV